jgi:predicted TIM-barrel fold metal-dependent hydrolase
MKAMERTEARGAGSTGVLTVDCDVHPHFEQGLKDLLPYLPSSWRRRLGVGLESSWSGDVYASRFSLPKNVLYINPVGALRRDSYPPDGSIPGSDPAHVRRQLLDEAGVDRAVLLGGDVFGLGALPDPDLAAAVASAYNDWLTERWLEFDDRFRGALVVAPQDPALAAREIDRVAGRPGMVEVMLPLTNLLMGDRHYYPIYEAAERHGLPIGCHVNSVDGVFVKGPQLAGGVFTYYTEWHAALTEVYHANVISLVCQGVFERFPGLKVVIAEGGFAWLPDVLWRLDRNYQALRDEVPWLKRLPSQYVFDHLRFTTQPMPEPARPEHLATLCEVIEAGRTLLFSSDYPHWDFDNPAVALNRLPEAIRDRVRGRNAAELFGDRL